VQCRPNINSNTGWRPILFCKFLWAAWFHDRLMPKYVPVRKSPMTIVLIRFRNDRVICGGAFVLIVHDRKPVETWSCACFLFSFAFVNRTVCESVFPAFFFRFFRFMRKTNPAVNAQLWSPTNTSAFKYFVNGFPIHQKTRHSVFSIVQQTSEATSNGPGTATGGQTGSVEALKNMIFTLQGLAQPGLFMTAVFRALPFEISKI